MIVLLKPRCAETVSNRFNEVNFVLTISGTKLTDPVHSNKLLSRSNEVRKKRGPEDISSI